jgi:hypothetical protein
MKNVYKNKCKLKIYRICEEVCISTVRNRTRSWFCSEAFSRIFGISRKDYPLDKPRKVEVTIKFLD